MVFVLCSFQGSRHPLLAFLQPNMPSKRRVTMAAGIHLFPFRTEKLSPPAPMVLRGGPRGRVGRRPSLFWGTVGLCTRYNSADAGISRGHAGRFRLGLPYWWGSRLRRVRVPRGVG